MSEITVVIPVYNSEKYIARCIESVEKQRYKNFELLIINDGSKDNSQKIIEEYAEKYKNITLIEQENMGVSKTRNKAIMMAKSKYITFIDNDDFIDEDYLETLINNIEECDVIISGFRRPNENGKIIKELSLNCDNEWSKMMILAPWAKIYKREYLVKNNIKFLPNNIGEDVYFNLQVMLLTENIKIINYVGYNWFYNTESVSNTIQKDFRNIQVFNLLDECYNVLQEKNILDKNYEIIEMHFIRYIIWFLSFTTKKVPYNIVRQEYKELFKWLAERFPNYKKNKLIGLTKPKGEEKRVRVLNFLFMFFHKIGLGKVLMFLYSKI